MGEIAQQLVAGERLQLQKIGSGAVFFVEHRHQKIGRFQRLLRRLLLVDDGALHHPLETGGRLRLAAAAGRQQRGVFADALLQLYRQQGGVHAAGVKGFRHFGRMLQQAEQQLLQSDQFVAFFFGVVVETLDYFFQLFADHQISSTMHISGWPAASASDSTCCCLVCAMSRV